MAIIFDPDVPLHHQIFLQLRAEILDGIWVGRADFPGEEELAARYGVSVITSRRALTRLVGEGLLIRERGRRPRATFEPSGYRRSKAGPAIVPIGPQRYFTYRVLEIETRVAAAEACEVFGLDYGEPLWHCSRLRLYDGQPHSFVLNVQLPRIGEPHTRAQLEDLPMSVILMEQGFKLGAIKRRVSARLPSRSVAEHLGISAQSFTLFYTIVLTDESDTPLEWVQIALHPKEEPPLEVFDLQTGTAWTTEIV